MSLILKKNHCEGFSDQRGYASINQIHLVSVTDIHHHKASAILPHHQLPVHYCSAAQTSIQQKSRQVSFSFFFFFLIRYTPNKRILLTSSSTFVTLSLKFHTQHQRVIVSSFRILLYPFITAQYEAITFSSKQARYCQSCNPWDPGHTNGKCS